MLPDRHIVEGIARVVRVDGTTAWFEPEQTTSCGSCASSAGCGAGATGIGTVASRNAVRRFTLENVNQLRPGERVVVGVYDRALLKASLTAYALPLATTLTAGGIAEGAYGSDLATMAAMAGGFAFGLLAARVAARRLASRGELAPRFLRRARPGETCGTKESPA